MGGDKSGIAAVVLAGGLSSRTGSVHKLLAEVDGVPMIRKAVQAVMQAPVAAVAVVTGHQAADVRRALEGLDVALVANPDYETGIASSIKAGVAAVAGYAGALICLGDMPWVQPETLSKLIDSHKPGRIAVPVDSQARRGNPVLWDSAFFPQLTALTGDAGGRALIDTQADRVQAVAVDDPGAFRDVDTLDDLAALN